jgi:FkbM family methyltransferase
VNGNSDRPTLIFDVGVKAGAKAAAFARHNVKVVCFEPAPDCLERLRARFAENPEVAIVPASVGTLPISVFLEGTSISTFAGDWKHCCSEDATFERKINEPVLTLDSAIAEFGLPDYCKVDVEGFELSVLRGLSQVIPVISFKFCGESLPETTSCLEYLVSIGYRHFNVIYGENMIFRHGRWIEAGELLLELENHPHSLLWGNVFAASEDLVVPRVLSLLPSAPLSEFLPRPGATTLDILKWRGLSYSGVPLRLHLGCGEHLLAGYINIDYPTAHHNVMQTKPDFASNITQLSFSPGSVDEIRLHHVFEHFNRVVALSLLIRWHRWLKLGGRLHIETPDFEEEARAFLTSGLSFADRMSAIRSLEGDQTARWGYHIGQWFAERFEHTLNRLGFAKIEVYRSTSTHEPPLHNLTVIAIRDFERSRDEQLDAADALLWDSTVAAAERPSFEIWRSQLRRALAPEFDGAVTGPYGVALSTIDHRDDADLDGRDAADAFIPPAANANDANFSDLSSRLAQAEARTSELAALAESRAATLDRIRRHPAYRAYVQLRRVWRLVHRLSLLIVDGGITNHRDSPE